MVEHTLIQGGIYLTKFDPAKRDEVGKIRPAVILTSNTFLSSIPILMVCPLSTRSYPNCKDLHIEITARDHLLKTSYALPEHCRTISKARIASGCLGLVTKSELDLIMHRIQLMLAID